MNHPSSNIKYSNAPVNHTNVLTVILQALASWNIESISHDIRANFFEVEPEVIIEWPHPYNSPATRIPPVAVLSWYVDDDEEYIGYAIYDKAAGCMVAGEVELNVNDLASTVPVDLIKAVKG